MEELTSTLSERFDHVIFDTPPGPAVNAAMLDLGGRFRLLANAVDVVK